MPYLKTDVVRAVLEDLGVLDYTGAAVNANDSVRVGVRFDAVLAGLTAADIVTIDPNAISDAHFLPLTAYVVQECAPLFHRARNDDLATAAATELRHLARRAITAPVSTSDKFGAAVLRALKLLETAENPTATDLLSVSRRMPAILADLSRRDIISITNQASIADAEFEALVQFTAETLAPEVAARPADANAKGAAEAQLKSVAREGYTLSDTSLNRLAVRVLRALGAVGRTGNPSPKELETFTDRLENVLYELGARGIISLSDADDAEDQGALEALYDWLLVTLAPEQGQPLPAGTRIPTRQDAEQRLRRITAVGPDYVPMAVDYF